MARFSMAPERAREVETVGSALRELPHVATALDTATISRDQARALVLFVTPDTDADWAESAASMTVAQLRREAALAKPPSDEAADAAGEQRTLRFNRGVRPVWDAYSHETLRRIACDADTRFAYVQQGKVICTDARHRGPTPSQLLALWDRDGGCVHPGCRTRVHPYADLVFHRPDATIIPNAPPGIDPAIRDVIWN